ncbi:MAG: DUF1616 domain-containing protein [Caldilineaceae bacterium]
MGNRQSNRQSRWLPFIVLILAAGAGFGLAVPGGTAVLRIILGVCLVLIGPGLAITTALLPIKQLGSAEHVLAAGVSSIALAVLGGIVLNATPWGLQPLSWLALLGGVTAAAALAAFLRLQRLTRSFAGTGASRGPAGNWSAGVSPAPTVRLALPLVAIVLLGVAVYIARIPAPADRFQGYTTLWAAPSEGQAAPGARIGVQSGEFAPTSYRLEVRVNGQVTGEWPDLTLAPNQTWQTQLVLPEEQGTGMELEALLYRNDAPRIVYRQVRFSLGETDRTARADRTLAHDLASESIK